LKQDTKFLRLAIWRELRFPRLNYSY